jgi:uncharacterized BrkB/YihY/UPF0761 family membrane protein
MHTYDDGQTALIIFGIILVIILSVIFLTLLYVYYPDNEIFARLISSSTLMKMVGFSWSG